MEIGTILTNRRTKAKAAATYQREIIEELRQNTHFNLNEVHDLRELYKDLADCKVGHKKFVSIFRVRNVLWSWFDMGDAATIGKIVGLIEPDSKKYIKELGWVKLMSLLLRGSLLERIEICFKIYDKYNKNCLTRDLVEEYVFHTIRVGSIEEAEEIAPEMTTYLCNILDRDRDGVISFNDFRTSVLEMPNLLECFGDIFPKVEMLPAAELITLKRNCE